MVKHLAPLMDIVLLILNFTSKAAVVVIISPGYLILCLSIAVLTLLGSVLSDLILYNLLAYVMSPCQSSGIEFLDKRSIVSVPSITPWRSWVSLPISFQCWAPHSFNYCGCPRSYLCTLPYCLFLHP